MPNVPDSAAKALRKLSEALPLFDAHLANGCKHCRANRLRCCSVGRGFAGQCLEAASLVDGIWLVCELVPCVVEVAGQCVRLNFVPGT